MRVWPASLACYRPAPRSVYTAQAKDSNNLPWQDQSDGYARKRSFFDLTVARPRTADIYNRILAGEVDACTRLSRVKGWGGRFYWKTGST